MDEKDDVIDWVMVVGALFVVAVMFSLVVLFDLTF